MKIKRVEHIAIVVDSMKTSLDLMRDTLGLELAKHVKLQSDTWRTGQAGPKIIFPGPSATGNVVIERAELAAGH